MNSFGYYIIIRQEEVNYMLMGVMQGVSIFYYYTWFIWPFVFIFSLIAIVAFVIADMVTKRVKKIFY